MKPDWKDAPEWASYLAQDKDGWKETLEEKPVCGLKMNNRKIYLSMRQCGKTQMWIGYLKEMQKHLGNEDDFIAFIEMFDKSLADKIRKEQEQMNE